MHPDDPTDGSGPRTSAPAGRVAALLAENGSRPVSISNATTPSA